MRNKVNRIRNTDGLWLESLEEVDDAFLAFFRELYTTEEITNVDNFPSDIPTVVSYEMKEALVFPVTIDEVKNAIFNLGAFKAPRPNDSVVLFFQTY